MSEVVEKTCCEEYLWQADIEGKGKCGMTSAEIQARRAKLQTGSTAIRIPMVKPVDLSESAFRLNDHAYVPDRVFTMA